MKLGKRDLRKLALLFAASNLNGQLGGMDMDSDELNEVLADLEPELKRIVQELLKKSGMSEVEVSFEDCVARFRPFSFKGEDNEQHRQAQKSDLSSQGKSSQRGPRAQTKG
jgi:hypothetical protein